MFSNDRNIETIGQLVETLRHYASLQGEYVKLNVAEKTVKVLTVIAVTTILAVLVLLMLIYLSFAAAYALVPCVGHVAAFALVAAFYLLVLILVVTFRKRWIERPLVRFFADILLH